MKKLIFVITLILAIALGSYGKSSNKNIELLRRLKRASAETQFGTVSENGEYRKASFNFNGKKVDVLYDLESNDLIGFSFPVTLAELPKGSFENIRSKFGGCIVDETLMFIYKTGYFEFYASLKRPYKKTMVVDINTKGKVHRYEKMQMHPTSNK